MEEVVGEHALVLSSAVGLFEGQGVLGVDRGAGISDRTNSFYAIFESLGGGLGKLL